MLDNEINITTSEQNTLLARGYQLIKQINEGSYAKVFLTDYKNINKDKRSQLACKIIDTSVAPKDFVKKFLPRELDMLIKFNHPHIVHTHSIFQRKSKYFIFMRYVENGDLLDFILKNGSIPEDQARFWIRQLCLALQYMHEMEIAHRDIKCENILITGNYNIKLSDFGFARLCIDSKCRPLLSETYCGSLSYTAPEVLRGIPYDAKKADVWSLGIVLYVMLNKAMPFDDKNVKKLYQAQMNKKWRLRTRVVDTLSDQCKVLLKDMIEPSLSTRLNIAQVLDNDWISMDSRLIGEPTFVVFIANMVEC